MTSILQVIREQRNYKGYTYNIKLMGMPVSPNNINVIETKTQMGIVCHCILLHFYFAKYILKFSLNARITDLLGCYNGVFIAESVTVSSCVL